MKKVFISFSSKQTEEATRICHLLESQGISCFISTRDLMPGEEYAAQLLNHIDEAKVVVLLLSQSANDSPHVLREVEYAVSHKTPILVYSLEEVTLSKSMEYYLMTHQWVVGNQNKDEKLISSLRHLFQTKDFPYDEKMPDFTHFPTKSVNSTGNASDNYAGNSTVNAMDGSANNSETGFKFSNLLSRKVLIAGCAILLITLVAGLLFTFRNNKGESADIDSVASMETGENLENADSANGDSEEIAVGDIITFGTYYGEPIEWIAVKENDDGTVILLSRYIICMKAFDAAEGGEYNRDGDEEYWQIATIEEPELAVHVRGNGNWASSNLRRWLNSDSFTVNYPDQAPTREAVMENPYANEAGFLCNFNPKEREALVPVTHEQDNPVHWLSQESQDAVVDYVFLLSTEEIRWLDEANVSHYATPTPQCVENDESMYYSGLNNAYGLDNHYWWLRSTSTESADEVYLMATTMDDELVYLSASAGISSFGVRPAICIAKDALSD